VMCGVYLNAVQKKKRALKQFCFDEQVR
jgi:hypothetical protein